MGRNNSVKLGLDPALQDKGCIESLIKSLSRFSEKALSILSGQSDPDLSAQKIGPALPKIFVITQVFRIQKSEFRMTRFAP
jgi:hypothetical protein